MWLCHVSTKKRETPPLSLPHHIPLNWQVFKPRMQPVIVSRWDSTTNESVYSWSCPVSDLPLCSLSPIRPVKSRVWQRRRGPICCPCYITLSGWRSWGEMPFTKNSSLKTSTRSCKVAAFVAGDPLASGGPCVWSVRCFIPFRLLVSCPG